MSFGFNKDVIRALNQQEAGNIALGLTEKKVLTGVTSYDAIADGKKIISIQCDIDSTYSAVYADGTALPSAARVQNSIRSGVFNSIDQTVGQTILLLLDNK